MELGELYEPKPIWPFPKRIRRPSRGSSTVWRVRRIWATSPLPAKHHSSSNSRWLLGNSRKAQNKKKHVRHINPSSTLSFRAVCGNGRKVSGEKKRRENEMQQQLVLVFLYRKPMDHTQTRSERYTHTHIWITYTRHLNWYFGMCSWKVFLFKGQVWRPIKKKYQITCPFLFGVSKWHKSSSTGFPKELRQPLSRFVSWPFPKSHHNVYTHLTTSFFLFSVVASSNPKLSNFQNEKRLVSIRLLLLLP